MQWLGDNPWLVWVAVGVALAAVEAATVDFVFLMLAGGALAAAAAAAAGVSFPGQVVVVVVIALVLLATVRPILKRRLVGSEASRSIGAAGLLGRSARVVQTVTAVDGRVKLAGETWSARTADASEVCHPGQEVRVLSIEGATVVVTADVAHQRGT